MVPREVEDAEGVRWSCVQAYAGLAGQSAEPSAARIEGSGLFRVICTPSKGARSVELELPSRWEEEYSDERLLEEIESQSR